MACRCRQIAHGDRGADGGAVPAGCDNACGRFIVGIDKNGSTCANGHSSFGTKSDSAARGAMLKLLKDYRSAGKASSTAASVAPDWLDRQFQSGLDGCGVRTEIGAVETEACFKPQRVACAESDQSDIGRFDAMKAIQQFLRSRVLRA